VALEATVLEVVTPKAAVKMKDRVKKGRTMVVMSKKRNRVGRTTSQPTKKPE